MLALRTATVAFGADLGHVDAAAIPVAGRVPIAVAAPGICGRDVHASCGVPRSRFVNPFMSVTLPHGFAETVPPVEGDVTALAVEDRVTCRPTVPCAARAAGRPRKRQSRPVGGRYAGALADYVLPLRAEGRARPAIASAFPFDGGAEARARVKVGQRVGQSVLSMGGAVRGSR